MNISKYEFNIGDEVITIHGVRGKIIDICHCKECQKRGFFELIWEIDDETCSDVAVKTDYITNIEAENNFVHFHRIGKYQFNDIDKSDVLYAIGYFEKQMHSMKERLKFIESLEED